MSEYLSKKAVLESIDAEQIRLMGEYQSVTGYHKRYVTGKYDGLNWVKHQIQSGAFDADTSEVQRLRAALVEIKQLLNENRENDGEFLSWNHMQAWKVATQTLSTTSEPCPTCGINVESACPIGDAERVMELWNITNQRVNEPEDYLQQQYFAGKAIGIMDTLNALGITMPGINAPEKEENA